MRRHKGCETGRHVVHDCYDRPQQRHRLAVLPAGRSGFLRGRLARVAHLNLSLARIILEPRVIAERFTARKDLEVLDKGTIPSLATIQAAVRRSTVRCSSGSRLARCCCHRAFPAHLVGM
jgi:hypothetical protein